MRIMRQAALLALSLATAGAGASETISTTLHPTWIWARPRLDRGSMIGFFRPGQHLRKKGEAYARKDMQPCGGTWFEVEPAGFVCVGRFGVTEQLDAPQVSAAAQLPPKLAPLPYGYAASWGTPLYGRVPSEKEQREVEGNVAVWQTRAISLRAKLSASGMTLLPEFAIEPTAMPSFLEKGTPVPALLPGLDKRVALRAGFADGTRRLALLTSFKSGDRAFYLTSEHLIVPADRVQPARPSEFEGTALAAPDKEGDHLPLAWVRFQNVPAAVYAYDGEVAAKTETTLAYHVKAPIAPDDVVIRNQKYYELKTVPDGLTPGRYLIKASAVSRADALTVLPKGITGSDVWADVSLSRQTLVLYRGLVPFYATLVSTGSGGKGHVTPWGTYRVYQKHWSSRMNGPGRPSEGGGDPGDKPYNYDEVPYVQYLVGGIAIHAAWWHDGFGTPRSHGCINVAPRDALYLFQNLEPILPAGWYGMAPGRAGLPLGSWVHIRG
jgi:lipoprotein-anchoring transpeptidase ErfK/SrfK